MKEMFSWGEMEKGGELWQLLKREQLLEDADTIRHMINLDMSQQHSLLEGDSKGFACGFI